MTIKLGNLLPNQELKLKVKLIMQLEIVLGSYYFELPLGLYPDYSRHLAAEAGLAPYEYEFKYKMAIASQTKITNLSMPEDAVINTSDDQKLV